MIRLLQYLCPNRHAFVACFFDTERGNAQEAIELAEREFERIKANHWCGICGSHDLKWEESTTTFKDLAEAEAAALPIAFANATTRAFLDTTGQSYDQQRKN